MLKKHLKKIVSLVLVTMMAIGMSITAIAAEPYQNELEAVMDTSLADSGQVTHYDTTTGEMLVEDGELLTFDEVATIWNCKQSNFSFDFSYCSAYCQYSDMGKEA